MIIRIIGYSIVPLWIAPAAYYNLDWEKGSLGDNLSALCFLTAAALCFLALHWLSDRVLLVLAVVLGLGLTCNNSWNALENISTIDNRRIDDRKAKIEDSDRRSSTRSEWSAAVAAAKLKVQLKSAGELQREVDAYVSKNATAWTATGQCNPLMTTRSREFCAEVSRLKGLVEVAKDRDQKETRIREADAGAEGKVKPTNTDDMAATVLLMLQPFSIVPTPAAIRAWRGATKTFWLEMQAAIMPAIWIALVDAAIAAISGALCLASAASTRLQNRATKHETIDTSAPVETKLESTAVKVPRTKITPAFLRFCADELQTGDPTWSIDPTPAFRLWEDWCRVRRIDPGKQKGFGLMMTKAGPEAGWHRDPNNGYPRYLGVRQKLRGLRIAA